MSLFAKQIQSILVSIATPVGKTAHTKFVPGSEKIYGVRMPVLNELAKQFIIGGFDLVEELWKAGSLKEKKLAAKMPGKIA
jgi:hypothetical protein